MKRNLEKLSDKEYDVIIVGAGIFGCCALWDAVGRGLSAVLIDKGDFSQATSANHYKFVHGGIRYLQHADFARVRESSRERSALLRIAPHMVKPMPIVIPTYGHGIKGKEVLASGLLIYDLVTYNRNKGIKDKNQQIPGGQLLSKGEILNLFPGIDQNNLTGGVIFYDAQMYNPPRLALSFLHSAVKEGADAENYLEATGFLQKDDRIFGIKAEDTLTGDQLEIRGKMVLNTAGPWADYLLEQGGIQLDPKPIYSRDLAFVVSRKFNDKYSFACQIKSEDADAIIDRGGRHIFISPWRNYSLVGVWHKVYKEHPDIVTAAEEELQTYIDDVNNAYPMFDLSLDDITMVNTGLTLFGEENKQGERTLSFGHRSMLIDHEKTHNKKGVITLIGVRATTARGMAEKANDLILSKLNKKNIKSFTEFTPIYGGEIEYFEKFVSNSIKEFAYLNLDNDVIRALIHNYGTEFKNVLKYAKNDKSFGESISGTKTIKAEVVHAVKEEMAQKLTDVVFRRTDLGTGSNPGDEVLDICAGLMADELGWSAERKEKELSEVRSVFENHGSIKNYSKALQTKLENIS